MNYQEIMTAFSQSGIGALVLSRDGVILSVNEAGDRLLCGQGKLVGQQLIDIAGELGQESNKPVYTCVEFDHYVTRCTTPEADGLPDGAQLIVFRNAVDDACHDMLISVVNQLEEAVILCDEHGRIYLVNDAAEKMDALVTQDVRGMPVSEVYFMRDGEECGTPQVLKTTQAILNRRQSYTTRFGHDVDIVVNMYPIVQNGQVLGASSIMQDWRTLDLLRKQIIDLQDQLVEQSSNGRPTKAKPLSAHYRFHDIIHISPVMDELIAQCQQAARSNSSVMIYGETGTGKELIAHSIHNASSRADGPFLAINCAAIPENLLESLLFGTERGAYTGAESKPGLFEQANHGTLLLDEVNSMNINLQAKLLRVLQDKRIRRVGGTEEIQVDVRVISNTNVPPYQAIEEGKLRRDLFYRLGVVSITAPPLRERPEDIRLLANSFCLKYNEEFHRKVSGIDEKTFSLFQNYSWPGNVRELQHAIEHAMNILPDTQSVISPKYLPRHILDEDTAKQIVKELQPPPRLLGPLDDIIRKFEYDAIFQALKDAGGNVSEAARILQIDRQKLQYRINRYKIEPEASAK
ncbi:sigma-54 interaction domain-containing protein [Oscillibacter sp. GMB15532]|uniref:sigma-54 interaction domain-containing protein n=1 Tax=Oscillibacter sp. GMB15532 TaxID=3230022 RepID=UPI0034DFD086